MKECRADYIFKATKREVYDFFLDSDHEEIKLDDYPALYFSFEPKTRYSRKEKEAAYFIILQVDINFYAQGKLEKIINEAEVAEIRFHQIEADQCKAELWVETDPAVWFGQDDNTAVTWGAPVQMGLECLDQIWADCIDEWENPPPRLTPFNPPGVSSSGQYSSDEAFYRREDFVFDTTRGNFEKILQTCSDQITVMASVVSWQEMEAPKNFDAALMGLLRSMLLGGELEGIIKVCIAQYSPEQIKVLMEFSADTPKNTFIKFCDDLVKEIHKFGRLWLAGESPGKAGDTADPVERNRDVTAEEFIAMINQGALDGCDMGRETAIKTVEAIMDLFKNYAPLTVQAIADKAGFDRRHYYNFRQGCLKAGIEKINGINIIDLKSNNK